VEPTGAHPTVNVFCACLSGIRPPPAEGLEPNLRCSCTDGHSLLGGVKGSLADSPARAALDSALRDERSSAYKRSGAM
jgi:hypothetical protein